MLGARAWLVSPAARIRLAVLVALMGAMLTLPASVATAVTTPRTLVHERPVSSAPVEPGFPIDHVGVVFDLAPGADPGHAHHDGDSHATQIAVRFRTDGRWSPWRTVAEDGAQAAGTWTGALVSGDDADAYQVRGLPSDARRARAAAINTTDGPREVTGYGRAGEASAATPCRSRAEWGADESLRTSTRAFAPLQVLTVHHTATQNSDPDPDARVRAIYAYHVLTNGWDDIGYQALIAEDGTVYEGRWSGSDSAACSTGGTGADFGHLTTDADADVVTGAHSGGYNTGNFGVALLGTFETVGPTSAAREGLVNYLTELTGRHGLDPESQVAYDNGVNAITVPAIAGHRDFVATACPGAILYDDLPAIRTDVATAGGTGGGSVGVATGERTVSGTVDGSYLDTHTVGEGAETITEVGSGGRPSRRHSLLEHVWTVPAPAAGSLTLTIDATASTSADQESFLVEVSRDGGSTYTSVVTIPPGGSGTSTGPVPAAPAAGDVLVRVRDSDRTAGANALDHVVVDRLVLTDAGSDGGTGGTEDPSEPAPIELTANGSKVKGEHQVALSWTATTSVRVYRDGVVVAEVTGGSSYTDDIGAKGSATYVHRVCATDGSGACSNEVTTTF